MAVPTSASVLTGLPQVRLGELARDLDRVHAPERAEDATPVALICVDDDYQGRRTEVLWELELGARAVRAPQKPPQKPPQLAVSHRSQRLAPARPSPAASAQEGAIEPGILARRGSVSPPNRGLRCKHLEARLAGHMEIVPPVVDLVAGGAFVDCVTQASTG
jgi:hypothetical protein